MTRFCRHGAIILAVAAAFGGCASAQRPLTPATATQPAGQAPFIALYRRGPRYDASRTIFQQQSIPEHIAHHEALGDRLISAGTLRGAPEGVVGVIVIYARDEAEAQAWLRADPGIVSGVLTGTIAAWGTRQIRPYSRAR